MYHYMDNLSFKRLCGFRKGYNTLYCLLKMFEKWKPAVDKGKLFCPLLTDLSKAFDCLSIMTFSLKNCMLMGFAFWH